MMTTMAATTAHRITISFTFSHQNFFNFVAWDQGSHQQSLQHFRLPAFKVTGGWSGKNSENPE